MFVSKKKYKKLKEAYTAAQNRALELAIEVDTHKKRASDFAYTAEVNLSKLKDREAEIKRLNEHFELAEPIDIVTIQAETCINPDIMNLSSDRQAYIDNRLMDMARSLGRMAHDDKLIEFKSLVDERGITTVIGYLKVVKEK